MALLVLMLRILVPWLDQLGAGNYMSPSRVNALGREESSRGTAEGKLFSAFCGSPQVYAYFCLIWLDAAW